MGEHAMLIHVQFPVWTTKPEQVIVNSSSGRKETFFLERGSSTSWFFFFNGKLPKKKKIWFQTAVKIEEITVSFKEGQIMIEQDFNQTALSSAVFKAYSFPWADRSLLSSAFSDLLQDLCFLDSETSAPLIHIRHPILAFFSCTININTMPKVQA